MFVCFTMTHGQPLMSPGPEPGSPLPNSHPECGCSLCWSSIILLVLPYPLLAPPLPPCLLHIGTLPFGEADWLWLGRPWGSDREYSGAQGSLLHRPSCRIPLLSLGTVTLLLKKQERGLGDSSDQLLWSSSQVEK